MAEHEAWAVWLDGSNANISADFPVSEPFSSFTHLEGLGPIRQVTGGPHDLAVEAAREHGIESFTEQYSIHGGVLQIGSVQVSGERLGSYRQWVAAWEGSHYSVKTSQVDGEGDLLLSFFQVIDLDEVDHGVILRLPPDGSITRITRDTLVTSMAINFSGLGIVETFPMTVDFEQRLPTYPGQEVRGGELYYDGSVDPETGRVLFVLANDSTYSVVYPRAPLEDVVGKLQSLRIDHFSGEPPGEFSSKLQAVRPVTR